MRLKRARPQNKPLKSFKLSRHSLSLRPTMVLWTSVLRSWVSKEVVAKCSPETPSLMHQVQTTMRTSSMERAIQPLSVMVPTSGILLLSNLKRFMCRRRLSLPKITRQIRPLGLSTIRPPLRMLSRSVQKIRTPRMATRLKHKHQTHRRHQTRTHPQQRQNWTNLTKMARSS